MVGKSIALTLAVLVAGTALAQDDTVVRNVTPQRLEKVLLQHKVEFKKSAVKNEDVHYFVFKTGKFEVRLTSFGGQDLMLDSIFKPLPLDRVNRWNVSAKFSRASLQNDAKGEQFSVLEYNLDLKGGVTPEALQIYLTRFEEELKNFDLYISGPAPDTKILTSVAVERLEKVLKDLNITFQKKALSTGASVLEFEVDGQTVRLQDFDGKELRLAARFRPLSLEDVNNYNLNRKFIRAVNYKRDTTDLTVLEICMDCEPGVNEAMLRHFVIAFAEDVRHFADYVQKRAAK